ncbi:glycosyltransferase [Arthrobacter mobilis]|uniref:D-inositol 3-phosphate glycosyltransferase n=1 Tax=Arthrobacter mobilis TaxID=2724944 RepID=A0A7X6QMG9_9MICC|nr:glycosyltransferase [Arthrobacter mobilis]NKX56628.1 glycosyltransferase family 4 protein [Arthrobacter mobilis]
MAIPEEGVLTHVSAKSGTRPLKILIAADTYPPDVNGAAVFGFRLAQAMTRRGHEVHILAARPDKGPTCIEQRAEATVHRLRSHAVPTHETWRICLPWEIKRDIKRIFDEVQPDVVHIQCHYMIGQNTIAEASRRGIRTIATNHFMPENLEPFLPFPQWFLNIVARNSWRDMGRIMGKAAVVTTPTPLAAKAMREHARLEKVLPLSNGIDSANYEPAPGEVIEKPEHPTVLFVGRLAQEKHVDVLIEAVGRTDPALDVRLEIIGGGEVRPALEAKVAELGLQDRVHFAGHVDDAALRLAYLRATVFCQPGTAELQSLVSLEAMSASKPVLLANAMALPHLVEDGVNGYLFTPRDPADLAAKLELILRRSPEEIEAMGAASHMMAVKHSINKTMDTFERLYRGGTADDYLPAG